MEKELLSINLIGEKGKTTYDVVLEWMLYIGRLLVILTETIALIVFASRFYLDRRLIDLNDEIKNNQTIVSYFTQEQEYRKIEKKLAISKSNNSYSSTIYNLLEKILTKTDNQITIETLNLNKKTLTISAQAQSSALLNSLVQQLKTYPEIKTINVDKVENRTSNAVILITISAQL